MQKLIVWELSLDQIREMAEILAKASDAREVYYFGSRRWDKELSFGVVEFVIVTPNPSYFKQEQQEDLIEKLPLSFECLLTFIEEEVDIMTGAIPMWPPRN